LIFVIPLTVLYYRRGFSEGSIGTAVSFFCIAAVKMYRITTIQGAAPRYDLFFIDMIVPTTFFIGLLIVEYPGFRGFRLYEKLLFSTVAAGAVSIPLLWYVLKSPEFDAVLRAQVQAMIKVLTDTSNSGALPFTGADEIVRLSRIVFLNTYLAGYFFTFAMNWVLGTRIGGRSKGVFLEIPAFKQFRLPEKTVWVFLLSWATVLFSLLKDIGVVEIVAWNCALIVSVLYGSQGFGIIKIWMEKLNRGTRLAIIFVTISLIFIPGLNLVVMSGVPLLGVSELWINYRNKERS
jgi:hypothetical protein